MTIDGAIAQERETAKEQKKKYDKCHTRMRYCCEMCFHNPKCNKVAEYHKQLAEWLEELKHIRNLDKTNFSGGYNKGIGDFLQKADEVIPYTCSGTEFMRRIKKIADELKGGRNE